MRLIDADVSHLPAIRAIVNDVIASTNAIYEETPATEEETIAWFAAKRAKGFPVLVAIDETGVAGFASYGEFNPKSGYRDTVEHSLHVAPDRRGQGLGRRLLEAIEQRARDAGVRAMIGLIDSGNEPSRRLHTSAGYRLCGELPEIGHKFGRRLTVCYYVKHLESAAAEGTD
ncbi:N-acyltransferase YncA [Planctomycetes bacterium MalM25]|nr:N-acyltransferase YncA [Planctomycetes bacterium MalM25]